MNRPELYKQANGLQRRDALETISKYLYLVRWKAKSTDEEEVVLDLGCGSGDVTSEFLQPKIPSTCRLVGADISEEMLNFAAELYPNLELLSLDIGASTLPARLHNTFDHIFSFYCLHWIKDQRQAMQNIFNLLRPGGDMLICYLASNPIYDAYLNLSKMPEWKPYMKDVHKYISPFHFIKDVEGSVKKILAEIGFEIRLCSCTKKLYEYPNIDVVQRSMTAVNPFYIKLPECAKDNFVSDYVKELEKMRLLEENNNKCERVLMPYRLITVCASKPIN